MQMTTMNKWHLIVGLAALAFFALTGVYLRLHEPPMASLEGSPRMLLRSGHIYLLFGGLLNVMAGFAGELRRSTRLIRTGSVLLLVSPVLLAVGFCIESTGSGLDRPLTSLGVFAAWGGVLLLFIDFILASRKLRRTQ